MPNDWRNLDIKSIAKDAAKKTDDKLASQISSITRLRDDEVKQIFPEKGDVALFVELMTIVKSTDSKNKKIKQISENGERFANVIVTLLGKVV